MADLDLPERGLARRALDTAWALLTRPDAPPRARAVTAASPEALRGLAGDPAPRHVGRLHSMNGLNDTDGLHARGAGAAIARVDDGALDVDADVTMERLAAYLRAHRITVPVWGTHLVQTVAGAVNTGTHGSSLTHCALASDVTRVELIDATGAAHALDRGHPDFPFAVLGLGCLGAVTRYRLRVRPRICVERVVRHRALDAWRRDAPAAVGADDAPFESREAFVLYDHDLVVEVRRAQVDDDAPDAPFERMRASPAGDLAAEVAFFAGGPRHQRRMLTGLLPEHTTRGDNIALQAMTMSTTRRDHRGHRGCELAVALPDRAAALDALTAVLARHRGHVWPFVHVRHQRADALPLSASHGRDVAWLDFLAPTVCAPARWRRVLDDVHEALAPFAYRPHWAKAWPGGAAWVRAHTPALARFAAVRARYDPRNRLGNPLLDALRDGAP